MTVGIIIDLIRGLTTIFSKVLSWFLKIFTKEDQNQQELSDSSNNNEPFVINLPESDIQESKNPGKKVIPEVIFATELKQNSPNGDIIEIFDLNIKEN